MPYFNHSMAHNINEAMASVSIGNSSGQCSSSPNTPSFFSDRLTRSMPGCTHKDEQIYQHTDQQIADRYKLQMTQRKLLFMRTLLRSSVKQIEGTPGAIAIDTNKQLFQAYKINQSVVLHDSPHVKILEAKSTLAPGTAMSVRLYPTDAASSMHCKILRYLGRKHPFLVHTYEVFLDAEKVYVFQEYCVMGNLVEYLEQSQPLGERETVIWARMVYRALDFLGDQAIAHRDLSPIHLVVQPQHNGEVWLKLTGFNNAIIYWDCQTNDVHFCPCLPLEQMSEGGCTFQPPEVYGNPDTEQFDPILADVWSFGANIYYILTKQYPFNTFNPFNDIDQEIWHNTVRTNLTEECKQFLFALMRANANDRMPFDFIDGQPWMNPVTVASTPKPALISCKHEVAGKTYKLLKQPRVIASTDMLHECKAPTSNSKDGCQVYKCCQNNSKLRTKIKCSSKKVAPKCAAPAPSASPAPSAPPAPLVPKEKVGKQQQPAVKGKANKIGKKEERVASCWCKSKNTKQVERSVIGPGAIAKGEVKNYGNLTGPINFGHGGGNKDAKQ